MASPLNAVKLAALATTTLLLVSAIFVLAKTSEPTDRAQSDATTTTERAVVEYVVDGDTVDIAIDGSKERVRLIGVDTPETVSKQTPKQCFGAEASRALRDLIPPGTRLRVERDIEARDRFGRLLLYIYRAADNLFVNAWLVSQGYAAAVSYRPNTAFEAAFATAEAAAKQSQTGLWGACEGPDQPLE